MKRFAIQKALIFAPLEDIADWVLFTFKTICSSKQIRSRCWAPKHTHWYLQFSTRCYASHYMKFTVGSRSKLLDWCGDSTIVPYGYLLNDLSPRTDARLSYYTDHGPISSKFYIADLLKQLRSSEDEYIKFLKFQFVPIIFPQLHKFFSFSLVQKFPVSLRMHSKFA